MLARLVHLAAIVVLIVGAAGFEPTSSRAEADGAQIAAMRMVASVRQVAVGGVASAVHGSCHHETTCSPVIAPAPVSPARVFLHWHRDQPVDAARQPLFAITPVPPVPILTGAVQVAR